MCFMPCRARNNSRIVFPKTPTSTINQRSLFGDYGPPTLTIQDLENLLGKKADIFEEPIRKE